ncbi:hypothetical protein AV545_04510 [Paenibacillus jamilae]|uniref:hypothetical protein n=1 Tax=Paenibacillus jamilae TaxID=114136 RepID=UPI0007AC242F|nr:hypothetical protein [Paenibacillus jamilae]KZE65192.1 hypothetical protein AV545_04510 [Paenibacillus jamilae]
MKKLTAVILSLSTALAVFAPVSFAEDNSDNTIQNTTAEITESSVQDVPSSAITRFEQQGNPDARVEFVDPKLVEKNSVITPQAGDHRVYVKSEYALGSNQITGYSVGPIQKQTLIVSVAKGRTATRSSSLTVSGTVSITATVDAKIAYIVKESLTGNISGTVSKTYNTTDVYSGPPESSPYKTRNYYAAINYDQYNTTIVRYDYYDYYLGNVYQGRQAENAGYTYVNGTKKPINIEYPKDVNY